MTTLERTAYPTFKASLTSTELDAFYTPSAAEVAFSQAEARTRSGQLSVLVLLKAFQRLGYFPIAAAIPNSIIQHLRAYFQWRDFISAVPSRRSLRRYHAAIRRYLAVKPYDQTAQAFLAAHLAAIALTKDHPADLINIAVELLAKERYELPAFSTLDHLVSKIRSATNHQLFQQISEGLSAAEQTYLDQLLLSETPETQASLNLLKAPPKSATFAHLTQLQTKFNQLMTFGMPNAYYKDCPAPSDSLLQPKPKPLISLSCVSISPKSAAHSSSACCIKPKSKPVTTWWRCFSSGCSGSGNRQKLA